jgi:hypothetical protein
MRQCGNAAMRQCGNAAMRQCGADARRATRTPRTLLQSRTLLAAPKPTTLSGSQPAAQPRGEKTGDRPGRMSAFSVKLVRPRRETHRFTFHPIFSGGRRFPCRLKATVPSPDPYGGRPGVPTSAVWGIRRQTRRDQIRLADRHGHHHRGLRPARASSTASATSSSCSGPTASRRRTSARTSAASPPAPGRVVPPAGAAMVVGLGQVGGQAVGATRDDGFDDVQGLGPMRPVGGKVPGTGDDSPIGRDGIHVKVCVPTTRFCVRVSSRRRRDAEMGKANHDGRRGWP